ncbi:MAG: hypothetical protein IJ841_04010 [Prevotella sp.]|nr:hypothetical protein [Prevotella sp.]
MKRKVYIAPIVREVKIKAELMLVEGSGVVEVAKGGYDEDCNGSRGRRWSYDDDDW